MPLFLRIIVTGKDANSTDYLNNEEIKRYFLYFDDKDWFPLGNNITEIEPGGLGEYFKEQLKKAPNMQAIILQSGFLKASLFFDMD